MMSLFRCLIPYVHPSGRWFHDGMLLRLAHQHRPHPVCFRLELTLSLLTIFYKLGIHSRVRNDVKLRIAVPNLMLQTHSCVLAHLQAYEGQ
jgi:hypothetical protein